MPHLRNDDMKWSIFISNEDCTTTIVVSNIGIPLPCIKINRNDQKASQNVLKYIFSDLGMHWTNDDHFTAMTGATIWLNPP